MRGLCQNLSSQLGAEVLARLKALDEYDLGFLYDHWVEKTQGLIGAGEVELAARELKRFLALPVIFPASEIFPPTRIDACWHEFILFTRDYRQFCREVLGLEYFDHNPRPAIDPTMAGPQRTLQLYTRAFGPAPSEMWGPVTAAEQRWLLYQHSFPDLVSKRRLLSRLAKRITR